MLHFSQSLMTTFGISSIMLEIYNKKDAIKVLFLLFKKVIELKSYQVGMSEVMDVTHV